MEGVSSEAACFTMIGVTSNFLLLLDGFGCLFALGVAGDEIVFGMTLEPLPVFFSCHTTCSTVGDEERVRTRFPPFIVKKGSWIK